LRLIWVFVCEVGLCLSLSEPDSLFAVQSQLCSETCWGASVLTRTGCWRCWTGWRDERGSWSSFTASAADIEPTTERWEWGDTTETHDSSLELLQTLFSEEMELDCFARKQRGMILFLFSAKSVLETISFINVLITSATLQQQSDFTRNCWSYCRPQCWCRDCNILHWARWNIIATQVSSLRLTAVTRAGVTMLRWVIGGDQEQWWPPVWCLSNNCPEWSWSQWVVSSGHSEACLDQSSILLSLFRILHWTVFFFKSLQNYTFERFRRRTLRTPTGHDTNTELWAAN